jgi:hypothetical protein
MGVRPESELGGSDIVKKIILALAMMAGVALAATGETGVPVVALTQSGSGAGATGEVHWYELVANGYNYEGFKAPDLVTATKVWTLPNGDGTSGQVMSTNGSKILSWITPLTSASYPWTVGEGGTGVTSVGVNTQAILITGTTATGSFGLIANGTTGNTLSAGTPPTWASLNLAGGANYVTGTLPIANGGTGNTTGAATSLSISGQTGLLTMTGLTSINRIKTVRDAADTLLELGGSYTPTGTWTNLTLATPVLGTPQSGNLTNCTGYKGDSNLVTIGTVTSGSLSLTGGATITGQVPVANGGTGLATLTNAFALVCSGTTATGNFQNIAPVGYPAVLCSQTTSSLPVYSLGYQAKSSAYTVAVTDHMSILGVTAGAANTTSSLVTLPAVGSSNKGLIVWIKKADSGTGVGQQIPIACNVADGINGSTLNVNKVISNTQISGNTTATITTGTHGYVVGQIVTIAAVTNTAVNGTWQIATVPSGTTFTYTIPSSTNVNSADTGTSIAATTWLNQQYSTLGLMSTGTSGNGAGQGWGVIEQNGDWINPTATGTSITSATPGNLVTQCLPAGEWEISGMVTFIAANSTIMTSGQATITTTSATPGTNYGINQSVFVDSSTALSQTGAYQTNTISPQRFSFLVPTTVYLVQEAGFTTSTATANGNLNCRRMR